MKHYLILTTLIVAIIFSSCEKTEKVDNFPKHEGKLVANCFFSSDSTFKFILSKSLSPIDNAPFRQLNSTKAFIKIYEDNVLFDSLTCKGGGYPSYTSTSLKKPTANRNYRFECNYPGLGLTKGEDLLPDTAGIKKSKGYYTVINSYHSDDSIIYGQFTTNLNLDYFQNPQYMMVKIQDYSKYWQYAQDLYVDITDLNTANASEFVASKLFIENPSGIETLNLKWTNYYGILYKNKPTSSFLITTYTCSKASYEYLKRQALQLENQDDPFSQPTPMSNNIINGYGIFGGVNITRYSVTF